MQLSTRSKGARATTMCATIFMLVTLNGRHNRLRASDPESETSTASRSPVHGVVRPHGFGSIRDVSWNCDINSRLHGGIAVEDLFLIPAIIVVISQLPVSIRQPWIMVLFLVDFPIAIPVVIKNLSSAFQSILVCSTAWPKDRGNQEHADRKRFHARLRANDPGLRPGASDRDHAAQVSSPGSQQREG